MGALLSLRQAREKAGMTQDELARQSGLSQGQIAKLENYQRSMSADVAAVVGRILNVPADVLIDDSAAGFAQKAGRPVRRPGGGMGRPAKPRGFIQAATGFGDKQAAATMIPVKSIARGGGEQEMFLEDGPIDWTPAPHYLTTVRDGYAVYVAGESMVPRFRPGQLLFVHPHRHPWPGAGVVIVKANNAVLIKEYVRETGTEVVVREYRPTEREFSVPWLEIASLHAVIGLWEA